MSWLQIKYKELVYLKITPVATYSGQDQTFFFAICFVITVITLWSAFVVFIIILKGGEVLWVKPFTTIFFISSYDVIYM